jgi:RNA polymerase sigma-32 factor
MIQRILTEARTRPLSPDEQLRLIAAYRENEDPRIIRQLVETNLRLVAKIARQLDRTHGQSFDDLLQEGCLGLIEAIRRFDPAQGARLSTYAGFWIRAFILKHQMDNVRLVRAVRTRAERAAFFRGVVSSTEVSLDAPVTADRESAPDRQVEAAELAHKAHAAATKLERRLSARELTILRERVLADDPTPRPVVAKRVALSPERIRQIEGGLWMAIRDELEARPVAAAA